MTEPFLHLSRLLALPLARLREELSLLEGPPPEGLVEALANDPRRGARAVAQQLLASQDSRQHEADRLARLLGFERACWEEGVSLVAGVDEAGVGPLAGPLAAAAVILPPRIDLLSTLPGLDDSKRLSAARRQLLAERIRAAALAWSVVFVEAEEIDRVNVYQAGLLAMRRAVDSLALLPDRLLVDARTLPSCPIPQEALIRGDARSASIAAASILAKTARDQRMKELDALHPGYGLAVHQGYPTPAHLEAIQRLGPLPIHRRSFRPVREILELAPSADVQLPRPETPLPLFPVSPSVDELDPSRPSSRKGVQRL